MNQIKVLRKKTDDLKSKGRVVSAIEEDISYVEFRCIIGSIFNKLFLNKNANIKRIYIEIFYKEVVQMMEYLYDWRQVTKERKFDTACKNWDKTFLSTMTYNNMKLQTGGFLQYFRLCFHLNPRVKSIPILYSNQSSLECFFWCRENMDYIS